MIDYDLEKKRLNDLILVEKQKIKDLDNYRSPIQIAYDNKTPSQKIAFHILGVIGTISLGIMIYIFGGK